ncbi:MAG TPA: PDZ domain-containing protein [Gemmataceae bacterium]|jgi:serine protease Do
MSIRGLSLIAVCVVLSWTTVAQAQRGRREAEVATKTTPEFRAAFRDVVAAPARGTVRVRCDDKETALGAVVGADGWILTKASELKGEIVCQLHDGRELPARIVGVSEPYDLAMLKVKVKDLKPIEWRDSTADAVGSWLATPGMERDPVAVGVLSVATRKISGNELGRRSSSGGFLGVRIAAVKDGVKIAQVIPRGAAAKAGFEDDDIIIAVQSKPITDPDSLFKALQKTRAGQKITVRVKREEAELDLKPTLDKRPPDRSDFQNQLGSKLSDRRYGFPVILQHDSVLRPNDCGGPVVDLDGKVVGINIARAGRTETYAIPAEAVKPLLDDLKSGKLAPPK